jgi:hypothetical protein
MLNTPPAMHVVRVLEWAPNYVLAVLSHVKLEVLEQDHYSMTAQRHGSSSGWPNFQPCSI